MAPRKEPGFPRRPLLHTDAQGETPAAPVEPEEKPPIVATPASVPTPAPSGPDLSALMQLVASQAAMLQEMRAEMQGLRAAAEGAGAAARAAAEAAVTAASVKPAERFAGPGAGGGTGVKVVSAREAMSQILSYAQIQESIEEKFWFRLAPFDQKRGNMCRAHSFHQVRDKEGNAIRCIGGTGLPGDVPRWYKVDKETALSVAREKQHSERPFSKPLCQVVTARGRAMIDAFEDAYRDRHYGDRAASIEEAALQESRSGYPDQPVDYEDPVLATPAASVAGDGAGGNGRDLSVRDLTSDHREPAGPRAQPQVFDVPVEQRAAAERLLQSVPGINEAAGGGMAPR